MNLNENSQGLRTWRESTRPGTLDLNDAGTVQINVCGR